MKILSKCLVVLTVVSMSLVGCSDKTVENELKVESSSETSSSENNLDEGSEESNVIREFEFKAPYKTNIDQSLKLEGISKVPMVIDNVNSQPGNDLVSVVSSIPGYTGEYKLINEENSVIAEVVGDSSKETFSVILDYYKDTINGENMLYFRSASIQIIYADDTEENKALIEQDLITIGTYIKNSILPEEYLMSELDLNTLSIADNVNKDNDVSIGTAEDTVQVYLQQNTNDCPDGKINIILAFTAHTYPMYLQYDCEESKKLRYEFVSEAVSNQEEYLSEIYYHVNTLEELGYSIKEFRLWDKYLTIEAVKPENEQDTANITYVLYQDDNDKFSYNLYTTSTSVDQSKGIDTCIEEVENVQKALFGTSFTDNEIIKDDYDTFMNTEDWEWDMSWGESEPMEFKDGYYVRMYTEFNSDYSENKEECPVKVSLSFERYNNTTK